jgi:hypothetical protein
MPVLDFKEIAEANKANGDQDSFELFARDFLEYEGYNIIEDPSRGQDRGKDLIVEETRRVNGKTDTIRWLVSCKHYAHNNKGKGKSVGVQDEPDIKDRVLTNDCKGFMGFYSTLPSSGLIPKFLNYKKQGEILTTHYDKEKIEKALLKNDEGKIIARRYFPKSMKKWEDIEKPIRQSVSDIATKIEKFNKNEFYHVDVKIDNDKVFYTVKPVTNDAGKKQPLKFEAKFPDTPEGRGKFKEYQDFIEKGSALTLPKEYISSIEFPNALKPFNITEDSIDQIFISPLVNGTVLNTSLEVVGQDSTIFSIDGIQMRIVQKGEKVMLVSNELQKDVPWHLYVTVDLVGGVEGHEIKFNFNINVTGFNAIVALKAQRLRDALASGKEIRLKDVDRNIDYVHGPIPLGENNSLKSGTIALYEKLAAIQTATHQIIKIPDRDFTSEEKEVIYETAEKVTGNGLKSNFVKFSFTTSYEWAKKVQETMDNGNALALRFEREETVNILGVKIPLGIVRYEVSSAVVKGQNLINLKESIRNYSDKVPNNGIDVVFEPNEHTSVTVMLVK